MSVTIPEFSTSAVITGQTLIAEADEQLNILMDDVKEYVETSYDEVATQVIADTAANALIASQAADSASDSADDAASSALIASQSAASIDIDNLPLAGFDTTAGTVVSTGQIAWNADEQTIDVGLNPDVTLQVGQESVALVRNGTTSTISDGTVVMATGSIGNSGRIVVAPHVGTDETASSVIGITTQAIASGADGFITLLGKIRGIDTTGASVGEVWVDGDKLYLKPNDSGKLTNVEPLDTEVNLEIAYVVKAHTSGTLYVRVNGFNRNHYKNWVNDRVVPIANSLAPYSGYMAWQKDNFVFNTSSSFLASIADKNRYLKFGDKVIDTYGEELINTGSTWTLETGYTRENNDITGTNVSTTFAYKNLISIETGKTYKVSYSLEILNGEIWINLYGNGIYGGGNTHTTSGYYEEYISVSAGSSTYTTSGILINPNGVSNFTIKNISVREIQTKSAIDYIPEVYVQDQATYGLITQQSVNAGDYVVVDREELVTNGTFDTDISGWVNESNWWQYSSGKAYHPATTGFYNFLSNVNLKAGVKYQIKFDLEITAGQVKLSARNLSSTSLGDIKTYTTSGSYIGEVIEYTPTVDVYYIGFARQNSSYSTEFTIDNISVKQVDEVYRATRDTADMYDIAVIPNVSFTPTTGDVIYLNDSFVNHSEHYFLRLATASTNTFNTSIDLSSSTNWIDLGTDTNMSLLNPYFEVRDNLPISNQIAFLHTMDATTKAYEGITNEILFNDALAIETPKAIMLKNGFSEVSKGLYSKGTKWYILAGYWQTLNKGAYHPVWNVAGTKYFRRVDLSEYTTTPWYSNLAPTILSVANSFMLNTYVSLAAGNGTSLSGRPDSKFYDIIYQDQFISFESSELAYKPTELEMKEIREYEKFKGVEGCVSFAKVSDTVARDSGNHVLYSYGNGVLVCKDSSFKPEYDDTKYLLISNDFSITKIVTFEKYSTSPDYYCVAVNAGLGLPAQNSNIQYKIIRITKYSYNSKGTSLTTDLIGSPLNYPTILKDRLAEGKGVFGINPLLVSDTGVNLIPEGTLKYYKLTGKATNLKDWLYSDNDGDTYGVSNVPFDYTKNSTTTTTDPSNRIRIANYTSQNNPYQATTSRTVLTVEPKVIASNSHSLYKGAITGNCIGKVQVGNGSNGYESKVLENTEKDRDDYDFIVTAGTTYTIKTGNYVLRSTNLDDNGIVFERIGGDVTSTFNASFLDYPTLYRPIYGFVTTPIHQSITLDNANSPASKWFEGLCYDDDYVYPFVVMEEMIWDYDLNNNGTTNEGDLEFVSITSTATSATAGIYYHITDGQFEGYWYVVKSVSGVSFQSSEWVEIDNKLCYQALNNQVYLERFDGNGFGDDDKFTQLTNGTLIDLNGNTVKTMFAIGSPIGRRG